MCRFRALLILLAFLSFPLGHARIAYDTQAWLQTWVQGPITEQYQYYLEIQPRFSNNISQTNMVLVRPAISYDLDGIHSLWLGYAWVPSYTNGYRSEHRAWQQVQRETKDHPMTWIHRFRLEERFLPVNEFSLRFRYMLRSLYALDRDEKWSVAFWDEIMLNLAGTPQQGVDQNRLFLGISRKWDFLRTELGYLNQYVKTGTPDDLLLDDQMNHAIYLMLAINF